MLENSPKVRDDLATLSTQLLVRNNKDTCWNSPKVRDDVATLSTRLLSRSNK